VRTELERYVFVKVDAEKHRSLAARFGVAGVPNLRILGPLGDTRFRHQGFVPPEKMLEILREHSED
jgi:hypothetical protein